MAAQKREFRLQAVRRENLLVHIRTAQSGNKRTINLRFSKALRDWGETGTKGAARFSLK